MKKEQFDRERFRKYALYAIGEMVLIVFGILIALQIDNWNTNRQKQATLDNYLQSIATNIYGDLAGLELIRAKREQALEHSVRSDYVVIKQRYTAAELSFARRAIENARDTYFLNTDLSGYEALKNSDTLDLLQGTDIEKLIYDYYDTAHRIRQAESSHNDYQRQLWLKVLEDWPIDLEEWEIGDPTILTAERFEEMQPLSRQLLTSRYVNSLLGRARTVSPLLLEYERLDALGTAIVSLVARRSLNFTSSEGFPPPYDPEGGFGYEDVIVDGRPAWHTLYAVIGDAKEYRISGQRSLSPEGYVERSSFDYQLFDRVDDSFQVTYAGGSEWAGIWLAVGDFSYERRSLDYSAFDKILIELKADVDGDVLRLSIEDEDDPRNNSVAFMDITLSNEWKTHEIDLAEFTETDLKTLRVVIGFVFSDRPQSFAVRSVRYVAAD